jgi:hypothetical protein
VNGFCILREEEQTAVGTARRRLETPVEKRALLRPFKRATELRDIALYWLPVSQYPVRARERSWILAFTRSLKSTLALSKQLRLETFLQFKALYPDLLDMFLSRSRQYQPLTGLVLQPGAKLPELPDFEDIEAEVKKGGPVNVQQWMPDYCYWFMAKQDEQQREDFIGLGGMTILFLAPDQNAQPDLKIPKIMRTHPAMKNVDIESKMRIAHSLQDKFLKQSKEVFGELIRDDPSYQGIPFILPLLKSPDFFRATPEQRARWFEVFDVYCAESKEDKGILLAFKDAQFDDSLIAIIQQLRDKDMVYPL